jgi:hypothetical protein
VVSFRRSVGAPDFEAVREPAVGAQDDTLAFREARMHFDRVRMAVPEGHDALGDALWPEDEDA